MFEQITSLLKDPPPSHIFEISEAGVAFARTGFTPELGFRPLAPGAITVSPLQDNVRNQEELSAAISSVLPANSNRKTRPAALILPDYAGRVAVLDFDTLPTGADEQLSLIRFRMRKGVPFDVESAAVSYYVQPKSNGAKKVDVVVAVMALEIVGRYEAPLRAAGFLPGAVTTSALAVLNLYQGTGITVLAKLSARTLTVMVLDGAVLKLVRCVELESPSSEEILAVLYPTLAYVEDELESLPAKLLLCGLGTLGEQVSHEWAADLKLEVEILRSRFGVPGPFNAGVMGYLEGM